MMVLDIIDTMKSAMPRINILHVHNPKKNYLVDRVKGTGIYKYLKERYLELADPNVNIELKEQG